MPLVLYNANQRGQSRQVGRNLFGENMGRHVLPGRLLDRSLLRKLKSDTLGRKSSPLLRIIPLLPEHMWVPTKRSRRNAAAIRIQVL